MWRARGFSSILQKCGQRSLDFSNYYFLYSFAAQYFLPPPPQKKKKKNPWKHQLHGLYTKTNLNTGIGLSKSDPKCWFWEKYREKTELFSKSMKPWGKAYHVEWINLNCMLSKFSSRRLEKVSNSSNDIHFCKVSLVIFLFAEKCGTIH